MLNIYIFCCLNFFVSLTFPMFNFRQFTYFSFRFSFVTGICSNNFKLVSIYVQFFLFFFHLFILFLCLINTIYIYTHSVTDLQWHAIFICSQFFFINIYTHIIISFAKDINNQYFIE